MPTLPKETTVAIDSNQTPNAVNELARKKHYKTNQTVPKPDSTKGEASSSGGQGSKEELAPAKDSGSGEQMGPEEDNLLLDEDLKKPDWSKGEMHEQSL